VCACILVEVAKPIFLVFYPDFCRDREYLRNLVRSYMQVRDTSRWQSDIFDSVENP
jgi:hypothetical protein